MTRKKLNLNYIVNTISQHQQTIKNFDVSSLALFGSFARNQATATSDLDFLVEFKGGATFDKYMNLKFFLEDLFQRPVDLVTKNSLKKAIYQTVLEEMIYVT